MRDKLIYTKETLKYIISSTKFLLPLKSNINILIYLPLVTLLMIITINDNYHNLMVINTYYNND